MKSHTSKSHQQQDNNSLGLRHQSKADRAKELFIRTTKIAIVIIILATSTIFGLSKLQKNEPKATTAPHYDANITQEPSNSNPKTENDGKPNAGNSVEYNPGSDKTTQSQRQTRNSTATNNTVTTNSSTTAQTDSYDPSKCQSYLDTSNNFKSVADAKYGELQNMMNNRLDYDTIYENNGRNAAIADQAYKLQEAKIDAKQKEWKDSLSARNKAYEKHQSCMASL